MANFETIQLTKKETIYKWHKLDNLAVNGNIPDEKGWYAIQRAHQKLYPIIRPMNERRAEVEKKMIVRDKAGRFTNDLKEGFTFDDFEKAIEAIESEEIIDVEIYKIKLSTLKSATMTNIMRQQIKIPPALLTDLQEWIINDFEESMEAQEKENQDNPEKKIIDLPRKPAE